MASIHHKNRSPYFWAAFRGSDGRRMFRSTGSTNRSAAMTIALEWERVAREGRAGRITEARIRAAMTDLFKRANSNDLPSQSVTKFLDSWQKTKSLEIADSSLAVYSQVCRLIVESLGKKSNDPVDAITMADAVAFRDGLAERLSPSTTNKLLKIARVVWNDAMRDGLTQDNPFAKTKRLKAVAATRRPFTVGEIQGLLAVASEDWRGMILSGLYLGQRLSDLANLTWRNVDLVKSEVTLVTGKTKRIMHIPIARPLADYLMTRPAADDPEAPLFPSLANLDSATLSNQFAALLAAVGLAEKKTHAKAKGGRSCRRQTNPLSFHCLRHTATTLLKTAGVSEALAMELIGHDTAAISRVYTHMSTAAMKDAVAMLPDVTKKEAAK